MLCFLFNPAKQVTTIYLIISRDIVSSTKLFMIAQVMIHYFKMDSYFKANRIYRDAFLENKSISSYPQNLNIKDFFMFLLHPTFVYQDSYPLTKPSSIGTIFGRLLFAGVILVSINSVRRKYRCCSTSYTRFSYFLLSK